jgi:hypothetical protein
LLKARKGQAKEALMSDATPKLPHHSDDIFLTDGGTETWLMYKRGFDLPEFSAFHLLNDKSATSAIREYYRAFADIAVSLGTGFIFDSLTYRASRDWGRLLGYSDEGLAEMNNRCLDLYRNIAVEAGLPGAARAGRLDHALNPGQMRRQMPTVAFRLAGLLTARPLHRGLGLLLRGLGTPWASSASSRGRLNWSGDNFSERLPNFSRCEVRRMSSSLRFASCDSASAASTSVRRAFRRAFSKTRAAVSMNQSESRRTRSGQ